jgi:hypothetical protein
LKLSNENLNECDNNFYILNIESENLEKTLEVFNDLSLEKVKNIFVIQLNFKCDIGIKGRENVKKKIEEKFQCTRPLLLQIFEFTKKFTFIKNRDEKFTFPAVSHNLCNEVEKSLKFSIQNFLQVQNCAICEFDFNKLVNFFGYEPLKFYLFAINAQDELCLRLLVLFKPQIDYDILSEVVKCGNYKMFLGYLMIFKDEDLKSSKIEKLIKFTQEKTQKNIFELAVENRNVKVVQTLLKFAENFQEFFNFALIEKSINFCIEKGIFEVYYEIIKYNVEYLSESDAKSLKEIIDSHKEVLEEIEKFFTNIVTENFDQINEFIEKYKKYKICYSPLGTCALEHSINLKKFKVYCYLRGKGFYTDKPEKLNLKIKNLESDEKIKIRDESLKYMKKDPKAFIYILASKCDFDPLSEIKTEEIREMLFKLSEMYDIRPFLEIAALSNGNFHFDYETKSIQVMDPTKGETTFGVVYSTNNSMYIGKDKSEFDHFGTFAHECAHYVFHLIYENKCLPYCEDDEERKKLWDEIRIQTYDINKDPVEPIVYYAYSSYPALEVKKIELAVRVCHMAAKYLNDSRKLNQLEVKFEKMFSFQREKVLPDLMIPNVYRLIKLNNDFGVIGRCQESKLRVGKFQKKSILNKFKDGIIILKSNVPQLTLSTIINEIKNVSANKLDLKIKNLFVDLEKLKQDHIKNEFQELLLSSKIERIIFEVTNLKCNVYEFLSELSDVQVIIISNNRLEIETAFKHKPVTSIEINHEFNEIIDEGKEEIKNFNVNFNGKSFKISQLLDNFDSISSEILSILCSKQVSISCGPSHKVPKIFIPRTIVKKKMRFNEESEKLEYEFEDFDLKDFIEDVKDDQIILLSDIAGSGKTIFLSKTYEILAEKFSNFWISFISLRDYIDEFSEGVGENFEDFIARILTLNALDCEIFYQKFSKGEVKIIFDAFDEISPECENKVLELLEIFRQQDENQIWLTTRTHLEKNLENDLDVLAHKLRILSENEQIEFLKEIWKSSHDNETFIAECADQLVYKLFTILDENFDAIGVPLIIEGLGVYFRDKINKKFKYEIENLKMSTIFKKIVLEASFKILREKFPEKVDEHLNKSESIIKVHQYWAIIYIFPKFTFYDRFRKSLNGKELASSLGLDYDTDEWSLNEIARGGILSYDENGKIKFNHEIYAENLVASFIFNFIKYSQLSPEFQFELFVSVVKEERFEITRMFLEDMLENFENKSFKIFNLSEKFCKAINRDGKFKFLYQLAVEGNSEFLRFILKLAKNENLINAQNDDKTTLLMLIFPKIRGEEKFIKLLNEVYEFYQDNILNHFLTKANDQEQTIFDHLMIDTMSAKNFEIFWKKVEDKNLSKSEIDKILFYKNKYGTNFLHASIEKYENNFEKVKKVFEIVQKNLSKNKQKKLIEIKVDCNFLRTSLQKDEIIFEFVLNFVTTLMSKEEFREFLNDISNYEYNIFKLATQYEKTDAIIKIIWMKISQTFAEDEQRKILIEKKIFFYSLLNRKTCDVFLFTFDLVKKLFCKTDIKNKIFDKINPIEKINATKPFGIFYFVASYSIKSIIINCFEKSIEILDESEYEQLWECLKGREGEELLKCASRNIEFNIVEFLWEFLDIKIATKGRQETLQNFLIKSTDFWAKRLSDFLIARNLVEDIEACYGAHMLMVSERKFLRGFISTKGKEFLNEALTITNEKSQNFLHIAAVEKWEISLVNFMLTVALNILSFYDFGIWESECEEFLFQLDEENFTPLHYAAKSNSIEFFEVFLEFYFRAFLTSKSCRETFFHKFRDFISKEGENFFLFLKSIPHQNIKIILEKLTSTVSYYEMKEILIMKSTKGKSISNFIDESVELGKLLRKSLDTYSMSEKIFGTVAEISKIVFFINQTRKYSDKPDVSYKDLENAYNPEK